MGRPGTDDKQEETVLIYRNRDKEDDEEEDALSLCNLPEDEEFDPRKEEEITGNEESFSFEFGLNSGLRAGSDSSEPTGMSTADELFFKGRILPLRHSLSSNAPVTVHNRSGSMDIRRTGSGSGFGSLSSSRSSSSGSERGIKNNFMNHSYPSPQPQIRRTSSLKARVSVSRRNPKNTIWEFLRLGLVRGPEIELQDIKNRNSQNSNRNRVSVSRNGSSSSTSTSNSSSKNSNKPLVENPKSDDRKSKQRKQKHGIIASDRKLGFIFGDCKCSVDTIDTIPLNYSYMGVDDLEEKLRNLQLKKKKEQKQALSRNRTFEWLKDIS